MISGIFHGISQLLNSIINPLNSRLPENLVTKRLTTKKPYNRAVPGLCELNRCVEFWLAQLALEYMCTIKNPVALFRSGTCGMYPKLS